MKNKIEDVVIGDFVGQEGNWDDVYPCLVLSKDSEKGLRVCEAFTDISDQVRWLKYWVVYSDKDQKYLHKQLKIKNAIKDPKIIRQIKLFNIKIKLGL